MFHDDANVIFFETDSSTGGGLLARDAAIISHKMKVVSVLISSTHQKVS